MLQNSMQQSKSRFIQLRQQIRNYEICEALNVELLLPIAGSQHSGSATWPECLMRDWRDESCWIHPRESDQRPTNDQMAWLHLRPCLGPCTVAHRRGNINLRLTFSFSQLVLWTAFFSDKFPAKHISKNKKIGLQQMTNIFTRKIFIAPFFNAQISSRRDQTSQIKQNADQSAVWKPNSRVASTKPG